MVSNFNVVMMYVIGGLEVLLPLTVLLMIYRYKSFLISSLVAGFACYFLLTTVLVDGLISMILLAIGDAFYFMEHSILGLLIESGLTALLMTPAFYLILTKLRKGKWSMYDTIAISVSYWVVPLLKNAAIMISQGSVARYANSGRLAELENEEYTIEALESLVASLNDISALEMIGQFFTVLISQATIIAVAVCLALLVFYAAKRKKISVLLLSMLVNFVSMLLMYGSDDVIGYWGSFAVVFIVGIAAVLFIRGFMKFYRRQQAELLRRRQEFKAEQHAKYLEEMEAKNK